MYTPNELMFPPHIIPELLDLRGPEWHNLVARVMDLPELHEEKLAFVLMMLRVNGCLECETDCFRAMRGCDACAIQTLRRYRGPDSELIALFDQALSEVKTFKNYHVDRFDEVDIILLT